MVVSHNKDSNVRDVILAMTMFTVCAVCGIIIALQDNVEVYRLLYLLPFCYGIVAFFALTLRGSYILKSMVSIFLFGGYFIKMVATPTLFAIGGYKSFYSVSMSEKSMDKALLIMCLETVVIFCLMTYYVKQSIGHKENELKLKEYNTRMFNIIVALVFVFLVATYMLIPAISEIYIFLPLADFSEVAEIRWDNETIVARGSMDRYLYSLFCFMWPIFRIIMPSLMITYFYKKLGTRSLGMFMSFLCLILPAILLGGDNIAPFIGILIGVIVINKLYKKKARKYLFVVGIFAAVLLGVVVSSKIELLSKWRGATGVSVFAQMLHNYFPGFDNLAAVFEMSQENKLETLFFDLYYAIPFKETLFGLHGDYIQDIFESYTRTSAQIIPFIGQLSYYLGAFSIVGIVFFVRLAYKMEIHSRQTDNFWKYFICMYLSVNTSIALSIYSLSIYFRGIVNVILPVYIIIKFVEKKRGNRVGK